MSVDLGGKVMHMVLMVCFDDVLNNINEWRFGWWHRSHCNVQNNQKELAFTVIVTTLSEDQTLIQSNCMED